MHLEELLNYRNVSITSSNGSGSTENLPCALSNDFHDLQIKLTKGKGTALTTIPRKEVTEAHRTLGVYVTPAGQF